MGGRPGSPSARSRPKGESQRGCGAGAVAVSDPTCITGPHAPDWESHSRPSKNNPSAPDSGSESPADGPAMSRRRWWHQKNDLVNEWLDTAPERAARPISVREGTTLREEATTSKADGSARSKAWSHVLREFLTWYNDYRHMYLRFRDPDGDLVRAPMPNSHQPQYGDTYYARLKALERQFLGTASNPHVVMLTLTASNKNENGGWRCPADHLRDVINSFTDHVRPALHRALGSNGADVDNWEYARVAEHHPGSAYGHVHVALFIDGAVSEADFRPVIDTHLRHCDPAGASAHNYYSLETEKRPISTSQVDTALDPEDYDGTKDVVGNLGSYIAEYVGAYGTELFERSVEELAFRATCWATSTNRVDFSNGAQELISTERDDGDKGEAEPMELSAADRQSGKSNLDQSASDALLDEDCWEFDGIGIVDQDGETCHSVEGEGVGYVEIEGSEHLDPPKRLPPDRPSLPQSDSTLADFD